MARKSITDIMLSIDRRIIFLAIGLSVAITLLFKFDMPIKPGTYASYYYNEMEKLRAGDVIMLAGVYDPATSPEIQPMLKATIRHAFRKKAKVITVAMWPQAPALLDRAMRNVLREPEFASKKLKYGTDYAHLGYMSGFMLVVKGMNKDIHETFPRDMYGTRLKDIEMMKSINNFEDLSIAIEYAAGGMSGSPIGSAWVMFAKPQNPTFRILAASTAVMAAEAYPYLQSKQIKGFLGGLKGGADYEALLGLGVEHKGALSYMPAQSVAHIIILMFILIGNIAYLIDRHKKSGRRNLWK